MRGVGRAAFWFFRSSSVRPSLLYCQYSTRFKAFQFDAPSHSRTYSTEPAPEEIKEEETPKPHGDIQDANVLFQNVWSKLEEKRGRENLRFPKEIIWLMGAPGAGKGSQTPFIQKIRSITAPPIIMSEILNSPEAQKMKKNADLVSDSVVLELLLERLLDPNYTSGVLIDGFPRTNIQAQFLRLLHQKMKDVRKDYYHTSYGPFFRRPAFRVCVLFIDEEESVLRQLNRGKESQKMNKKRQALGEEPTLEERDTDFNQEFARKRYAVFKKHYGTLRQLREHFHFSLIDAHGDIKEVEMKIKKEFAYQSSLELGEETYDSIQSLPIVDQVIKHTRQSLVQRLDRYQSHRTDLFHRVIHHLQHEFYPIIQKHAMAGKAFIESESKLFLENPVAVEMAVDILSERGFRVTFQRKEQKTPLRVNRENFEVVFELREYIEFRISFRTLDLRRPLDENETSLQ